MTVAVKKFSKAWLVGLGNNPPDSRVEYRHSENRYLRARVSPSGRVTLSVYKCPAGSRRAVRVGLDVTVSDAMPSFEVLRKRANKIIADLDKGINPNRPDVADTITLRVAMDKYLNNAQIRTSTAKGYRQRIEKHFAPWLDKPIVEVIDRGMLLTEHRRIAAQTPIAANSALQALRRILNYTRAMHEGIPEWPTEDLARLGLWVAQKPRDRKVHPKEFPDFWQAVLDLEDTEQRDYFMFLLLTGCRRREALNLTNIDVDKRRGEVTFRDTKNRKDHRLPYTKTLLEIIERRQSMVGEKAGQALFTLREPKSITKHIKRATGLQISPHDLRRTFAAVGNTLVSTAILKALLNHKSGQDVTDDYIGEIDANTLLDALQRIENKMKSLAEISDVRKLEIVV